MEVKKYFEFFDTNKDDELSDRSDLANEILYSLEELIDMIDDQNDIEKLREVGKIVKKYI